MFLALTVISQRYKNLERMCPMARAQRRRNDSALSIFPTALENNSGPPSPTSAAIIILAVRDCATKLSRLLAEWRSYPPLKKAYLFD